MCWRAWSMRVGWLDEGRVGCPALLFFKAKRERHGSRQGRLPGVGEASSAGITAKARPVTRNNRTKTLIEGSAELLGSGVEVFGRAAEDLGRPAEVLGSAAEEHRQDAEEFGSAAKEHRQAVKQFRRAAAKHRRATSRQ